MRRVEDVEALDPERAADHLRREARAAHAEQDDRVDVVVGDGIGERLELGDSFAHAARLVEPAEPLRLVAAGPDGRVPFPDPVDQLSAIGRHAVASAPRFALTPSSSSANESANFCTPSSSSVSVTSS